MLRKSFCEQKSWIESDIYEQTNKWKLNAFFAKLVWSLTCLANIQKFEHHYLIEIFVKNHDLALYKVMISRNIFQRTVNFLFFCTVQFYQIYFKVLTQCLKLSQERKFKIGMMNCSFSRKSFIKMKFWFD